MAFVHMSQREWEWKWVRGMAVVVSRTSLSR